MAALSMWSNPYRCARPMPAGATLRARQRKERGSVRQIAGAEGAVFGAPGRARAAHVMLFRSVGADRVAGQFLPEVGEHSAEGGEGAPKGPVLWRIRGPQNRCNRSTHDLLLK